MSLPYEHPSLENFKKEKQKNRSTHKPIQKKNDFLKQESKAIDNNPRLHVLKQIFSQSPMFIFQILQLFQLQKAGNQLMNKF